MCPRVRADEVAGRNVLAQELGCARYYSDAGTIEEKAAVLARWIEGETRVLVATSALAGVDYPHVRVAFHVGEPSGGAIDYAQDVGRVGRDGQGGLCVVFLPPRWRPGYKEEGGEILPENTKAMQRLLDDPRCRMLPLGKFLDRQAQGCRSEVTACDRCKVLGVLQGGEPGESEEEEEYRGEEGELGNKLVREYNRQSAAELARFVQGLELLRGSCVICRFADKVSRQEAEHTLDECKSVNKWRSIQAKRRAQEQGRKIREGWLARYGACYKCDNMQVVCQGQGQGECRYKDIALPLSWLVLCRPEWEERVLRGLEGGLQAVREEGKYMLWLGEGATVFGEQASNLVVVADRVMWIIAREVYRS